MSNSTLSNCIRKGTGRRIKMEILSNVRADYFKEKKVAYAKEKLRTNEP
jgi:hypothetical protein